MSEGGLGTTTTAAPPSTTSDHFGGSGGPGGYRPEGNGAPAYSAGARRAGLGRVVTVAVLIVSLVVVAVARQAAMRFQHARLAPGVAGAGSRASLGGMNSFALALMLGGLRGPLVMILWAKSEAQKADRDLDSIDTQIEWIRLLQPEFDTVHIFQIWNKAYNLSVQMISLANKYTTILDALEYARNVDRERPDNINILNQIEGVYSQKLGNSFPEKHYYTNRLRTETQPHESRQQRLKRGDVGWRPLEHDVLLDEQRNLLPHLYAARYPRPAGPLPDDEWYDGSELQYLKQFEPFRYGISPFAFGYNYAKRCQVLMTQGKQKPLQVSPIVIDSRPAIELKNWAEEEWERSRRLELRAFGIKPPTDRNELELPTASVRFDQKPSDPSLIDEMVYGYRRAASLTEAARTEYQRHLRNPEYVLSKSQTYRSHLDDLSLTAQITAGDADYFAAAAASGAERDKLLRSARDHYTRAMHRAQLTILTYYTDDFVAQKAFPQNVTRANINELSGEQLGAVLNRTRQFFPPPQYDQYLEDRKEYDNYATRAGTRIRLIDGALGAS